LRRGKRSKARTKELCNILGKRHFPKFVTFFLVFKQIVWIRGNLIFQRKGEATPIRQHILEQGEISNL
jgi:hypothetical protein